MTATSLPRPRTAAVAVLAVLAFIYLRGFSSDPLKWEEPRRALVAQEMIHRGDYVVPRLLGEPYLNKPPLQNWLIAALAGLQARQVSPAVVRGVTLWSLALTASLLFWLGIGHGRDLRPALAFMTTGLTIQYLRTGELDGLFTFLVTASLGVYELGRRRSRPRVRWGLSQLVVGLGVLAKGLAPLFFYPPVLFVAWRRRKEAGLDRKALLLGAVVMAAVVAAWAVPYSQRAPASALGARLAEEVTQRTLAPGLFGALAHLPLYPAVMMAAAAPWSLVAFALVTRQGRAALRETVRDPWVELCAVATAWGLLVFAFVPGTLPRYLLPVLPAASVVTAAVLERLAPPGRVLQARAPWALVALGFAVFVFGRGRTEIGMLEPAERTPLLSLVACLGLVTVGSGYALARRGQALVAWPLTLGLLYGLGYAGLREARVGFENRSYVRAAGALAAAIDEKRPVVVGPAIDRKLSYPLATRLDRPLREARPDRPYFYVGAVASQPPRTATLVRVAEGFAVWRVVPPGTPPP